MRLTLERNRILISCDLDDLQRFYKNGEVEEAVTFGDAFGDKIVYALQYSHSYEKMTVGMIANELRVMVPKPIALEFITTERDAFGGIIDIGEGRELFVRVEKSQPDIYVTGKEDSSSDHGQVEQSV